MSARSLSCRTAPRTAWVAFALCVLAVPVHAQWTQAAGPRGAQFHSLVAVEGGVVGSLGNGGVFHFDGADWAPVHPTAGALHPVGSDVYAEVQGGLIRSRDGGLTYEPGPVLPEHARFLGADRGHLVATRDSVVFMTTDDGTSWTAFSAAGWATVDFGTQQMSFRSPLHDVVGAVRTDSGTMIAAASVYVFGDLYRLAPGDTVWTPVLFNATRTDAARSVHGLVWFGERFFALTSAGVFASSDDGVTWDSLSVDLSDLDTGAETELLAGRDALFLRVGNAFYRLDGTRFQRLPDAPAHPYVLAASASDGLYASGPGAVYRLDPSGWMELPAPVATTPFVRYANGPTAVIEVEGQVLHTDDAGATFSPFAASGPAGLRALTFVNEHLVFGHSDAGPVRSSDGGLTWSPTGRPPAPEWLGRLAPGTPVAHGNAVYAAFGASWCIEHCAGTGTDEWGGIYRTTDGGGTWEAVMTGLPMGPQYPATIRALFSDGVHLFAETATGCVRGEGGPWTRVACPPDGYHKYAADGSRWFALSSLTLSTSTDAGASWTAGTAGLPLGAEVQSYTSHLIPTPAGLLLVVDVEGAATAFRFSGEQWVPVEGGFPTDIRWVSFAMGGGMLYGGSNGRGLWRTPLAALTATENDPDQATRSLALTVPTPNPVRSTATLVLTGSVPTAVRVEAFDVLGRSAAVLYDGALGSAPLSLTLDAAALPAGMYLLRATAQGASITRTVTVIH